MLELCGELDLTLESHGVDCSHHLRWQDLDDNAAFEPDFFRHKDPAHPGTSELSLDPIQVRQVPLELLYGRAWNLVAGRMRDSQQSGRDKEFAQTVEIPSGTVVCLEQSDQVLTQCHIVPARLRHERIAPLRGYLEELHEKFAEPLVLGCAGRCRATVV
jgi:hypothetical protein